MLGRKSLFTPRTKNNMSDHGLQDYAIMVMIDIFKGTMSWLTIESSRF